MGPLNQSVACIITHAAILTHFSVTEATLVGVYPPLICRALITAVFVLW